jgi:hypothetical protein
MFGYPIVFWVLIVRCAGRVSASAFVAVLLVALCLAAFSQSNVISSASASSTLPGDVEFAGGTVTNDPYGAWYGWVNVSGTQVVNYVFYSNISNYPTPTVNFVGQRFLLADGTEVFVASAFFEMEVYRDLNGDGVPQVNLTSGDNELVYYMYMNMSDGCSITPIQKTVDGEVPHYLWGFTYDNVYAYLQYATPTGRGRIAASLIFDHLTVDYDFSINGNVTNLKTSFDIGKVASLTSPDGSSFSLDGLGLTLLFTTSTYSTKPYSTSVDGEPYNSSTAADSVVDMQIAQVTVGDEKAYDFVFGGNYTLNREAGNETHSASVETYQMKTEAVPASSLPVNVYQPAVWQIGFFKDLLNFTAFFGDSSFSEFNMDYDSSSLTYRICFPVWDGMQIQHDPVYVGYIYNNAEIPEFPAAIAITLLAVGTLLVLVLTKKHRRAFNKAS